MKHVFVATVVATLVLSFPAAAAELTSSDYVFLKMDEKVTAKTFSPEDLSALHFIINDKNMSLADKRKMIDTIMGKDN